MINKFEYGAKIPKKSEDIPIIEFFSRNHKKNNLNQGSIKSLFKFNLPKRNDIVVFKSLMGNHNEKLIKRVIGLPGNKLEIKKTKIYINDSILPEYNTYLFDYFFNDKKNVAFSEIKNFSNEEYNNLPNKGKYTRFYERKRNNKFLGEIIIPKKGNIVDLNKENLTLYKELILRYENTKFIPKAGKRYKFKNNYYFLVGDNRSNSVDSRVFGFIPENYILGKFILKF